MLLSDWLSLIDLILQVAQLTARFSSRVCLDDLGVERQRSRTLQDEMERLLAEVSNI